MGVAQSLKNNLQASVIFEALICMYLQYNFLILVVVVHYVLNFCLLEGYHSPPLSPMKL